MASSGARTGLKAIISAVALLAGIALIVAAVRAVPPSDAEQRATAVRLEALLTVMDDLGLDGWHDCATCQPIDIRPGSSPEPLPSGATAFETMKEATQGLVPNGRLVEITTVTPSADLAPATNAIGRTVMFTAVAKSMVGAETGHDLWVWTWYEEPQPIGPDFLDAHWQFQARSADSQ
jgi:hypothetical protein